MRVKGYRAGKAFDIDLVQIDTKGHMLGPKAAKAFIKMRDDAWKDKVMLVVNSAFRSMDEQTDLYIDYMAGVRKDQVAKPGWSNHQAGTAVDLVTAKGTNKAFKWMEENGPRYGFHRTVKSEPWHWEFKDAV